MYASWRQFQYLGRYAATSRDSSGSSQLQFLDMQTRLRQASMRRSQDPRCLWVCIVSLSSWDWEAAGWFSSCASAYCSHHRFITASWDGPTPRVVIFLFLQDCSNILFGWWSSKIPTQTLCGLSGGLRLVLSAGRLYDLLWFRPYLSSACARNCLSCCRLLFQNTESFRCQPRLGLGPHSHIGGYVVGYSGVSLQSELE